MYAGHYGEHRFTTSWQMRIIAQALARSMRMDLFLEHGVSQKTRNWFGRE